MQECHHCLFYASVKELIESSSGEGKPATNSLKKICAKVTLVEVLVLNTTKEGNPSQRVQCYSFMWEKVLMVFFKCYQVKLIIF